jgi:hypothetical protein
MIEVKVPHKTPNEIIEIVRELREQGYIQGKDFDFSYNQAKWDPMTGHNVEPAGTVFKFYTEKYATLFVLKWS